MQMLMFVRVCEVEFMTSLIVAPGFTPLRWRRKGWWFKKNTINNVWKYCDSDMKLFIRVLFRHILYVCWHSQYKCIVRTVLNVECADVHSCVWPHPDYLYVRIWPHVSVLLFVTYIYIWSLGRSTCRYWLIENWWISSPSESYLI